MVGEKSKYTSNHDKRKQIKTELLKYKGFQIFKI